ncbi:hypothetical protein CEXT_246861 [Caerostris extrusa]|uniref:Uncharacterized protein n=1 Tax=Caerostris extrusa TaxID=172846 RepID=A0AAV4WCU1_CAEEX|nr:hypothetical protein CEXT_246861 [Caerostris extrusa]
MKHLKRKEGRHLSTVLHVHSALPCLPENRPRMACFHPLLQALSVLNHERWWSWSFIGFIVSLFWNIRELNLPPRRDKSLDGPGWVILFRYLQQMAE